MSLFLGRKPSATKPKLQDAIEGEIPVLYRVALRLTETASEAEDLVGQAMLQMVKGWDTFDGQFARSWMIKVLRNEHYANCRKSGLQTTSLELEAEPSIEGYWQAIDWKLVGPELTGALDGLPEEYRMVIALCDIEELTRDEAAVALELPVGTINSRLHRGRNMLRAKLSHLKDL